MTHNYILIMAGGVGSRFWPASRKAFPKQFLDILGTGKSLLQSTVERVDSMVSPENVYVITNERYCELVEEQLPDLPVENILGEPSRNNTAPCIFYALMHIRARDPEACIGVLPSDHLILKEEEFRDALTQSFSFVRDNAYICTLGIRPQRPDTGYGYIAYGPVVNNGFYEVRRFTEKPDKASAVEYLNSGEHLWNAGMFVFHQQVMYEAFRRHASGITECIGDPEVYGTDGEEEYIAKNYPETPDISIDYAIIEKADNVCTLPVEIGWSDLGTWNSLYQVLPRDENGNINLEETVLVLDESTDNLIRLPNKKLAVLKGLKDSILVESGDILLLWPREEEQEIKSLLQELKKRGGEPFM